MKIVLFVIAIALGVALGGMLATWIFFGILTFAGFVGLVESIPILKWIVYRTSGLFDVIIFGATIAATAALGVTVMASLTIAGLCFTFLYRPYIRMKKQERAPKQPKYKL